MVELILVSLTDPQKSDFKFLICAHSFCVRVSEFGSGVKSSAGTLYNKDVGNGSLNFEDK